MRRSAIEWTDATFNPWWGCERVSPACAHCYAEAFDRRIGGRHWGHDAPRRFFGDEHWREPVRWNRQAEREGQRIRVFSGSMCDVGERRADLRPHQLRLWRLIEETSWLTWMLLTKRPRDLRELVPWAEWPENVWALTTAENQEQADLRIPELLLIGARVNGVSVEPALGPVDLGEYLGCAFDGEHDHRRGTGPGLDWIIWGGESGRQRRDPDLAWLESIDQQTRDAGVALFVKQDSGPKPGKQGRIPDRLWARKELPA